MMNFMRRTTTALVLLLVCAGCRSDNGRGAADPATAADSAAARAAGGPETQGGRTVLVIASTTSTEDSGLFDALIPAFESAHPGIAVRLVAVGTGQALELGRRKDADVLLVHEQAAESKFVTDGSGEYRCNVMYNDFIIAGPAADPAGIARLQDPLAALRQIERTHSPFISRGDDSGTHRKELALWEEARIVPRGSWYMETGQGMGEVLTIAAEKSAYTIADRATFLALRDRHNLDVLLEGDRRLINQYGVVPVAGARNRAGASAFATWVTSAEAQQLIADYGTATFGRSLFTPNATACPPG